MTVKWLGLYGWSTKQSAWVTVVPIASSHAIGGVANCGWRAASASGVSLKTIMVIPCGMVSSLGVGGPKFKNGPVRVIRSADAAILPGSKSTVIVTVFKIGSAIFYHPFLSRSGTRPRCTNRSMRENPRGCPVRDRAATVGRYRQPAVKEGWDGSLPVADGPPRSAHTAVCSLPRRRARYERSRFSNLFDRGSNRQDRLAAEIGALQARPPGV